MDRRNFVRWTVVTGALGVAGCVADGDGSGSSGDPDDTPTEEDTPEADGSGGTDDSSSSAGSPAETVELFFQALDDGEGDAANALIHDDGEIESLSAANLQSNEEGDLSVERTITVEEGPGKAVVEVLVGLEESRIEGGVSAIRIELRANDGEWKLWSWSGAVEEIAPRARFDTATNDGTLEITHVEGDHIPADELYVRGEGLGATGSWQELGGTTDGGTVTAGDTLTVETDDEYSVSLVWDDGEVAVSFFGASGSSASEGVEGNDEPCPDEELPTTDAPEEVAEYLSDVDAYEGLVDWTGQSAVTVEVGSCENGLSFFPAAVQVDPGTTVTWEWTGLGGAHNVVAESGAFETDIYMEEGVTFEHTFEESGTFLYYCTPHKAVGMKGAIVVEG